MTNSTLETDNIRLRAIEPTDIELLYTWENNMALWSVSNTLTPFSRYALKRYIQNSQLDIYQTKQLRLVIETKEEPPRPIGLVDLFDFEPYHQRAGVGILIANTQDRNKGFASQTIKLIVNYAFNTLGLKQLYCNVASDNVSSLQLFANCGFKEIGTKKMWLKTINGWNDEIMFQIINN